MKARELALNCCKAIILDQQYSNLYLRKALKQIEEPDKSFITSLVYGTMQHSLSVRYQWEYLTEKPLPEDIAILLDMSFVQLYHMDKIPEFALVNEAVEIASKLHHGKYKGVVNAILRRKIREGKRPLPEEPVERLAIETSHPVWLVKMWLKQYGFEIAEKICQENQKIPVQTARVNLNEISIDELIHVYPEFEKSTLEGSVKIKNGNIADSEAYIKGFVTIQDESSQRVALVLDPKPNERILDCCAAPGTKTTHICQLMRDKGEIIACDLHEHRVKLMDQAAERLNYHSIHTRVLDATTCHEQFEKNSFDRVLVDVPCSGYGVLKRKNDIKVHMKPEDMDEIIPLQRSILESACQVVKQDGILVYSTCTLNKKENENQMKQFLERHPEFVSEHIETIFPFETGNDGFFICRMRKVVTERS